jgi:hypothetical protein
VSTSSLQWLFRIVIASATVTGLLFSLPPRDEDPATRPIVQTSALQEFDRTIAEATVEEKPRFTVVFFGDSFVLPEHLLARTEATPMQLRRQLGTMMREAGAGGPPDLRLIPFTFSGLSLWSLYYLSDAIAGLRPEYVIVEFNLFNFSDHWSRSDRRILSAMLPVHRFLEALELPLHETRLTFDEWLFGRLVLRLGAVPLWEAVQSEQARASDCYRSLEDDAQHLVGSSRLEFREQIALLRLADMRETGRDRSTRELSRQMLGTSLDGIGSDAPALQMLSAALQHLNAARIPVLVYVPPYNVDHLRELGLLTSSRLDETIARVRAATERNGARFLDAHALLGDAYFRDAMDHLYERGAANGHRALAFELARAMSEDWKRILEAHR